MLSRRRQPPRHWISPETSSNIRGRMVEIIPAPVHVPVPVPDPSSVRPSSVIRNPQSAIRNSKVPLLLLAVYMSLAPGCVERLLQIRSEPSGAEVFVNGQRAGLTPLDHRFDFYGTFDITLRAKNHFSSRVLEPVRPPWYQLFPIDLVAEDLVPVKIQVRHPVRRVLQPAPPFDFDDPKVEAQAKEILQKMKALEAKAASGPEATPTP
jgi:PEGA domain-containing protein